MENKHKIEIYSPCYEGSRFDDHRLPLDFLDDLLMLKKMTIEMAKAIYFEKNPERKKVPPNFTDGISIELESIQSGSTLPKLVLITAFNGLLTETNTEHFTQAPERIKMAIETAHLNQDIKDTIPNNVLIFFNKLGSNLKEDERIIFGDKHTSKAILDKESRKRLVLAASKRKEYNAPFELRGIITALDKERKTFEIQSVTGAKIKGDYSIEYLDVLQNALVEMENQRKIHLKGIGTFNASDKLVKIEGLEDATALDPLDVPARLEELAQLKLGWLDGHQYGEPLDADAVEKIGKDFDQFYDSENLPLPATFPTPEGNLQFEWSLMNNEVSLLVDLKSKKGEYFALNTENQQEVVEQLDLATYEAWKRLNHLIKLIHG
jgi:hypothetical protein